MPAFLIFAGLLLIVSGVQGTQGDLFTLVRGDFFGQGNFFYWLLAIGIIVVIGRVPKLKGLSDAFLALVIIVILINNHGFLAQLDSAIGTKLTGGAAAQPGQPSQSGQTGATGMGDATVIELTHPGIITHG